LRAVAERRILYVDIPEEHSPSNCMGICVCAREDALPNDCYG